MGRRLPTIWELTSSPSMSVAFQLCTQGHSREPILPPLLVKAEICPGRSVSAVDLVRATAAGSCSCMSCPASDAGADFAGELVAGFFLAGELSAEPDLGRFRRPRSDAVRFFEGCTGGGVGCLVGGVAVLGSGEAIFDVGVGGFSDEVGPSCCSGFSGVFICCCSAPEGLVPRSISTSRADTSALAW